MKKRYDWLIVGAGFTGATLAERLASQYRQRVLLVERRGHIGGNAYDLYDQNGILIHKYGPHILHTADPEVWDYLSAFTEWRHYEHRVLAEFAGRRLPIPFNLNTLHALFPGGEAGGLEKKLLDRYGPDGQVSVLAMKAEPDPELRSLADFVYQHFFYHYTLKQWGRPPEELDAQVTARVPLRISRDDRYFLDSRQGLPLDGYSRMFQRMLAHEGIELRLETDYNSIKDQVEYGALVHTGPLDEFFDLEFGPLAYRSLRFEFVHQAQARVQEAGTVNYPDRRPCTRSTEFKILTGQESAGSTLVFEYPRDYIAGKNEPYYPVPGPENRKIHQLYRQRAQELPGRVYFAGRLADYRYYNMDQAVARALELCRSLAKGHDDPELARTRA